MLCAWRQIAPTPEQPAPADKAPKEHHDFAACCVWHGVAGAVLARAALVEPLTFVSIRVAFASPPADIPARKPGSTRARAPPIGAHAPRHLIDKPPRPLWGAPRIDHPLALNGEIPMRRTLYAGRWARLALASSLVVAQTGSALAHGFAGDRFFPATILTDDPFVADEISLPQVTVNPPGPDGAKETDIQIDLSKRITPNFGITIGDQWQRLKPTGLPAIVRAWPVGDRRPIPAFRRRTPPGTRPRRARRDLGTYRARGGGCARFHDLVADLRFRKGLWRFARIADLAAAVGDHRQFERRLSDQDTKRWNGQTRTPSIMVLRSNTAFSISSITCGMSGLQPHSTG